MGKIGGYAIAVDPGLVQRIVGKKEGTRYGGGGALRVRWAETGEGSSACPLTRGSGEQSGWR